MKRQTMITPLIKNSIDRLSRSSLNGVVSAEEGKGPTGNGQVVFWSIRESV
jgi:hypothetical protein